MKSLIPYMGGKTRLVPTLIPIIQHVPHDCYCEPFCGGASVLFAKPPGLSKAEVINDADSELARFFRVLQNHYLFFVDVYRNAVVSRQMFEWEKMKNPETLTDLQRAARFYYLQRLAFGGKTGSKRVFGYSLHDRPKLNIDSISTDLEEFHHRLKGAGITGERSGLWTQFARIIREVEPAYAFVENSPMLASRGLDVVLADLAEMGFDAEWCVLGADAVGAPHHRERIWILASHPGRQHGVFPSTPRRCDSPHDLWQHGEFNDALAACPAWPRGQSAVGVMDDGLAPWVDEFRAIGNGHVPAVAARA
jgi:hypothetical protein